MKVHQISKLIKDTGLSPEKLAIYFQVSNMTLRRWLKKPITYKVPTQYETNLHQGILSLVKDGLLPKENEIVLESYDFMQSLSTKNSFMMMDLTVEQFEKNVQDEEGTVDLCLKLGQKDESLSYIQQNEEKLKEYETKSSGIGEKVSTLWKVLKGSDVQRTNKYVAIGALFYLLFPFDFIPDAIPAVGFLDDLAVLGVAVDYYIKLKPFKG
ncbi:YkvA family protein [Bdellovibrio svalbardensis]|uniref:YkvA family protein n=1 Tax=Bdellovibrio svalbardensis TaxID=2972972 RepID=A0ABT6DQS9_9BACT|nr:YkvA family protein [Bdellovibrio svalbardensis]MDG0817518.1 YkvA family protein [Bdellovibrio svalbardensis]